MGRGSRRAIQAWETCEVDIGELMASDENPRRIHVHEKRALRASLEAFGDLGGVVWNRRTRALVGGHQRVAIMRTLGEQRVTVRVVDMDAATERAARLALNSSSLSGVWDDEMLAAVLSQVAADTPALFDALRLADIAPVDIGDGGPPDGARDEGAPGGTSACASGDVWTLGAHTLGCVDSSDADAMAHIRRGVTEGVRVIDPPFDVGDAWASWIMDPCVVFGTVSMMLLIPRALWRFERVLLKSSGHRSATTQVSHAHVIVAQVGTDRRLPRVRDTFTSVVTPAMVDSDHPHEKPVSLIVEHLTHWTPHFGAVLDPYAGSGATLMAAEAMGRACIAAEVDPARCAAIVERWQSHTGRRAVRWQVEV